jgi:divalent metal cation (Fe/Co/Zn/Cd) transporter
LVLRTEGKLPFVDGVLAAAVLVGLVGLVLNSLFGLWWADPLAGYVVTHYAVREAREMFSGSH